MDDLERLRLELRRREGVLSSCFDKQRNAIQHLATRKAVLTPRRAGKTTTCIADATVDQADHPGAQYVYVALTRPAAEQIAWPIARQMDRDFNLGAHFQEAKLRITYKSGAQLRLVGADQAEWTERLRGIKARRIYVDEAAFYRVNLKKLLHEVLEPALMDEDGTLWLIGTPGDICAGLFYDVTVKGEPGWEVFRWSTADNPYVAEQYQKRLKELKDLNPNIEKDPGFRREYLGEYCEDERGLVYGQAEQIDKYSFDQETDHAVLGVDFGYREDQTSFTLGVYNDHHPDYVVIESWKKEKMLVPDIAEEIRDYERRFPGLYKVGDPSSSQLMDELRQRFGIAIYDAQKTEKYNWIRLYNSDVATGRVKFVVSGTQQLISEQKKLQRQQKYEQQWREWPGQPNDCCDSNLYAYRHCYQYRYQPVDEGPRPGSPEALEQEMDEYWEAECEAFEQSNRRRGF